MLVETCNISQSLLLLLIYVIPIQSCVHLSTSFILTYFRNQSFHNKLSNQMSILLFPSSLIIAVKLLTFKSFFYNFRSYILILWPQQFKLFRTNASEQVATRGKYTI